MDPEYNESNRHAPEVHSEQGALMKCGELGAYIGRAVRFAAFRDVSAFPHGISLSDTIVMLCLEADTTPGPEVDSLFRTLGYALPLAVKVYGPAASALFGRMVEYFDAERPLLHVMTGQCPDDNLTDALKDFLSATWPTEGRFDDWQAYLIVTFGDTAYCEHVEKVARSLVDRRS